MEVNQIAIYTSPKGEVYIEARLKDETLWLTQKQIAELFGVKIPAVSKHINNILEEAELSKEATVSKMEIVQKEGFRQVKRTNEVFSLDMVLSVGYRVNSKEATQFRIWATRTLKSYLVKGYAINEKILLEQRNQLEEIKKTILMIGEKSSSEVMKGHERDLLEIISEYARSWKVLDEFDAGELLVSHLQKTIEYELEYQQSKRFIEEMQQEIAKSGRGNELFGRESNEKLKSIIGSINQTYDSEDLYPSLEEKAAHLLYFVIKDHPFVDGNKRIGSMLFLYFLKRNDFLYRSDGEVKINDNAIIALALLVAVSNPREKDNIIRLIINLIQG